MDNNNIDPRLIEDDDHIVDEIGKIEKDGLVIKFFKNLFKRKK